MTKFIAVASALPSDPGVLKRNLTLFDQLRIVDLQEQRLLFRDHPTLVAELDMLEGRGLVAPALDPTTDWRNEHRIGPLQRQVIGFFDALQQKRLRLAWPSARSSVIKAQLHLFDQMRKQVLARVTALELRGTKQADAVVLPSTDLDFGLPIATSYNDFPTLHRLAVSFPAVTRILTPERKDDVAEVVLGRFPVPVDTTSWEDVTLFREDPDSRRKFLALKVWINDAARGTLSPPELQDLLEHNMAEYQRHLELHHIKYKMGTLRLVLTSAAELLEEIRQLNFRKALDVFFQASKQKVALLEAEATAPGRELAYIVKARKRFGFLFR